MILGKLYSYLPATYQPTISHITDHNMTETWNTFACDTLFYRLKELDRAGFKVTGATGTNILRSLSTLGRIVVDKKEGIRLSVL